MPVRRVLWFLAVALAGLALQSTRIDPGSTRGPRPPRHGPKRTRNGTLRGPERTRLLPVAVSLILVAAATSVFSPWTVAPATPTGPDREALAAEIASPSPSGGDAGGPPGAPLSAPYQAQGAPPAGLAIEPQPAPPSSQPAAVPQPDQVPVAGPPPAAPPADPPASVLPPPPVPSAGSLEEPGRARLAGAQPPVSAEPPPLEGVAADSYIVMEASTGRVLAGHQPNKRRPPASLTKVMTALLALERGGLWDVVTIDDEVLNLRNSTLMGLKPGDQVNLVDLLYGLMLPSGNDAAIAVAKHISGSQAAFVQQMNRRAASIGLRDTHFANPHGLDSRRGDHFSTAYDMAQLARVAMNHPAFERLAATSYHVGYTQQRPHSQYRMANLNRLLGSYPGADGVKIGFTNGAGQTIIGSATRNGVRLIVAVLGSEDRFTDAAALLDLGFKRLQEGR